ncbi:acetyltransferase [soil metagenome]
MKKKLIIIGSGGHGRVVADAALKSDEFDVIGFTDDNIAPGKIIIDKYVVVARAEEIEKIKTLAEYFIVAIGNNEIRKKIFETFSEILKPATVIHPFTSISPFAKIGKGVVILAGAVVSANAQIGDDCIINVQSLVDHDSIVGKHSHISRGVMVGSHCTLPENSMLSENYSSDYGK